MEGSGELRVRPTLCPADNPKPRRNAAHACWKQPSMPTGVWRRFYLAISDRTEEGVFMNRLGRCGLALVLALGCCAFGAKAQFKNGGQAVELRLPTLSQRAVTTQRVGLTDITINYCRPLVNGREIWGKAVPYGQGWRSGAHENTTISFTGAC